MKNTIKRLPFILAFVVTLFVASCSDDSTIEPVHTDGSGGGTYPLPPPPPGTSTTSSDTTSIG